jgi:hypothetical protein
MGKSGYLELDILATLKMETLKLYLQISLEKKFNSIT